MRAFPSWAALKELASQHGPEICCLSLYLDLDPQTTPTVPALAARMNALVDEAKKRVDACELERETRQGLRQALDRVGEYYSADYERNALGGHGLAVFASASGFFMPLKLSDPVQDQVCLERGFHLAPLIASLSRNREALVCLAGREQGRVYLLRRGLVIEVDDVSEGIHGQHDQGGWSQARYERSIENDYRDHLKRLADVIFRLSQEERRPIALLGPEEAKGELLRQLEQIDARLPELVAGWGVAETHSTPQQLAEKAAPQLEEWWARWERELLDSWQQATGKPDGRGVSGFAATLAAAADGRVETLLYDDTDRAHSWPRAYECPECGRGAPEPGSCPLDGAELEEREDGLDVLAREALRYGGQVWAIRHDERLGPGEGVGALLRY